MKKTHKNKYFQGYKKLKNIKMFEQFVNEFDLKDDQEDPIEDDGYKNHPKAKYVITKEDAQKLVAADEDNLAPGEKGMDDISSFLRNLMNERKSKRIIEFEKWTRQ